MTPQLIVLPADRAERLTAMHSYFPEATGPALSQTMRGGRAAGLQRLAQVNAVNYAKSRNYLNGQVSRLSPFLRHGALHANEVVAHALAQHGAQAEKFVSEVAYRDFFRQAWYRFQTAILQNMEPAKVVLGQQPLPADLSQAQSGVVCMDDVVKQLHTVGYVHNHARMWFAAYVVHWLKVDWRQAADWFEAHLLDGDLASNHLSWQWVASTFSHKPYFFNKENLVRFAGDAHCKRCQADCPFDDSYEALQQRLFQEVEVINPPYPKAKQASAISVHSRRDDLPVWVHDEMLSPQHPLLNTTQAKVFIFDPALYGHWPLKRLQWMADALAEMPEVAVWLGETTAVWQQLSMRQVQSQRSPQSKLKAVSAGLQVNWVAETPFTGAALSEHHLMRFTRYWKKVAPEVMGDAYRG